MGIIQEMLTQDHEKKQTIDRKVSEQHIMPTQGEQQKANDVIRIISEKYADKLKDHSIQEIENELIEAIREECESLNLSYEEQKRIQCRILNILSMMIHRITIHSRILEIMGLWINI